MKKLLLLALPLMVCGIASCSDDPKGPTEPAVEYDTITFEDCEYAAGKLSNFEAYGESSFTSFGATFTINNYYGMLTGAGVSSKQELPDRNNASPKGGAVAIASDVEHPGADGSDKYCFISRYSDKETPLFGFTFDGGAERTVSSVMVMNSAEIYQYAKLGFYSCAPLPEGGYVKATFTGYDAAGEETGSVDIYLADYREGELKILTDWTELSLESLGKANKVVADVNWSEGWEPGYGTSWSVCIDNIKIIKETEAE